jgi:hypothetical protein
MSAGYDERDWRVRAMSDHTLGARSDNRYRNPGEFRPQNGLPARFPARRT